jgi:CPA2 family monovalent cation:H+ antiporter-2
MVVMDMWTAIGDIVILLASAMLLGLILERLGQSAILGYLIAGTLLGPGAFNVIHEGRHVAHLADIGVALLLFTIGLTFSWRHLRSLGAVAFGGGVVQLVSTTLLVQLVCMALGQPTMAAAAIGLIVAASGTACMLRVFVDRAETESVHARVSIGICLLQDMAVIPLMLFITSAGSGGTAWEILAGLLKNAGLIAALVAGVYVMTSLVLPRVFTAAALVKNRELPILLAVTTCLASSWAAAALGLSPALGAFAAGVLLAESPYATGIQADVGVLRTLFLTIFFTAIGTLGDLGWLVAHGWWLAAAVPAVVIGKAAVVVVIGLIFKMPLRHALATGLCLGQMGEFSFVLAQMGHEGGLLSDTTLRMMISVTLATLILTPFLVASSARFGAAGERLLRRWGLSVASANAYAASAEKLENHVVVVGYGPAGQGVVTELRARGVPVAVVDLNPQSVAAARASGLPAELGDATHDLVLHRLAAAEARAIVVTLPDYRTVLDVIDQARRVAPDAKILARARYHIHAPLLTERGATIFDEETETGQRLGMKVLAILGSV